MSSGPGSWFFFSSRCILSSCVVDKLGQLISSCHAAIKLSNPHFSSFLIQYHINDYDTAIFVDQQQLPADSGVAMEIDASRDGLDYYVTTPQKVCLTPSPSTPQCDIAVH